VFLKYNGLFRFRRTIFINVCIKRRRHSTDALSYEILFCTYFSIDILYIPYNDLLGHSKELIKKNKKKLVSLHYVKRGKVKFNELFISQTWINLIIDYSPIGILHCLNPSDFEWQDSGGYLSFSAKLLTAVFVLLFQIEL